MSRKNRSFAAVVFAGIFATPSFACHQMAEGNGNGGGGDSKSTRVDAAGIKWTTWPVKSEGKTVGQVESPEFDETDADKGMKQISDFDWAAHGYKNWKHAAVSLVNTQFGTNLRNKLRQQHSGKVTQGAIEAMAMSRITIEEFQSAVGDAAKFAALRDAKIKEVKAEIEAKKKEGQAAAQAAGTASEEAADAEAEEAGAVA